MTDDQKREKLRAIIEPPTPFEPLKVWLEFRKELETLPQGRVVKATIAAADQTIAWKRAGKQKIKLI